MKTDFDRAARILSELRLHAANPSSDKAIELAIALDQADGLHPRARCLLVELVRHFRRMDEVHGIMVDTFGITGDELGVGGAFAHPTDDSGTLPDLGWEYHFHGVGFCVTRNEGAVIDVDFNRNGKPIFDWFFYDSFLESVPDPDLAIEQVNRGISENYRVDLERLFRRGLIDADHRFRMTRSGNKYGESLLSFYEATRLESCELVFVRVDVGRRLELLVEFLEGELKDGNRDALASLALFAPARVVSRIRDFLREPRFQSTAVEIVCNEPDSEFDEHLWWFLETEMDNKNDYAALAAARQLVMRGPEHTDGGRVAPILSGLMERGNPEAATLLLPLHPRGALDHLRSCLNSEVPYRMRTAAATLVAAATHWTEAVQILNEAEGTTAHYARALMSGVEIAERDPIPDGFVEYRGEPKPVYTWEEISKAALPSDLRYELNQIHLTIAPMWELWRLSDSNTIA